MPTSAIPPPREPVKPTALMRGSATRADPVSISPSRSENTPSGRPDAETAAWIACPTSSPVPGCAGCPFTTTGQPAASAEAVSPPATEKASGKLLAPKTATGPRAMLRSRRSARGKGLRSGKAGSMRRSSHSPRRTTSAKSLSWPIVRARSPSMRARQAGLGARPFDESVPDVEDVGRDGLQKARPLLKTGLAVAVEGVPGQGAGALHVGRAREGEGGLKRFAGRGVDGAE